MTVEFTGARQHRGIMQPGEKQEAPPSKAASAEVEYWTARKQDAEHHLVNAMRRMAEETEARLKRMEEEAKQREYREQAAKSSWWHRFTGKAPA